MPFSKAELEPAIAQQWLSLFAHETPLGVIEWDLDWKVRRWNQQALKIFGWSAEEAVGQDFKFIVPPAIYSEIHQIFQSLASQSGGLRSTNENITKNQQLIICDWYNKPIVDSSGKVVAIASLVKDITHECNVQEQVDALLTLIPGLVCHLDFALKYRYVNTRLATYHGLTKADFIGKSIGFLEASQEFKVSIEEFLKQDSKEKVWESSAIAQGKQCYFIISAKKYRDGIIAVGIDITDRKILENKLKESEERNASFLKVIPEVVREMEKSPSDRYAERLQDLILQFNQHGSSPKNENLVRIEAQIYEYSSRLVQMEKTLFHDSQNLVSRIKELEVKQIQDRENSKRQDEKLGNFYTLTVVGDMIKNTPGGLKTWSVMGILVFLLVITVVDLTIRTTGLDNYIRQFLRTNFLYQTPNSNE